MAPRTTVESFTGKNARCARVQTRAESVSSTPPPPILVGDVHRLPAERVVANPHRTPPGQAVSGSSSSPVSRYGGPASRNVRCRQHKQRTPDLLDAHRRSRTRPSASGLGRRCQHRPSSITSCSSAVMHFGHTMTSPPASSDSHRHDDSAPSSMLGAGAMHRAQWLSTGMLTPQSFPDAVNRRHIGGHYGQGSGSGRRRSTRLGPPRSPRSVTHRADDRHGEAVPDLVAARGAIVDGNGVTTTPFRR